METFGRAAARIAVAGALVLSMIGLVHAAGALAIGPCGAYGLAYDHAARTMPPAPRRCANAPAKAARWSPR